MIKTNTVIEKNLRCKEQFGQEIVFKFQKLFSIRMNYLVTFKNIRPYQASLWHKGKILYGNWISTLSSEGQRAQAWKKSVLYLEPVIVQQPITREKQETVSAHTPLSGAQGSQIQECSNAVSGSRIWNSNMPVLHDRNKYRSRKWSSVFKVPEKKQDTEKVSFL